jgi:hypothetical protein
VIRFEQELHAIMAISALLCAANAVRGRNWNEFLLMAAMLGYCLYRLEPLEPDDA